MTWKELYPLATEVAVSLGVEPQGSPFSKNNFGFACWTERKATSEGILHEMAHAILLRLDLPWTSGRIHEEIRSLPPSKRDTQELLTMASVVAFARAQGLRLGIEPLAEYALRTLECYDRAAGAPLVRRRVESLARKSAAARTAAVMFDLIQAGGC